MIDICFDQTDSSRPIKPLAEELIRIAIGERWPTLYDSCFPNTQSRTQEAWEMLARRSNLLGNALLNVKKKFAYGKKALRHHLILEGYDELQITDLWDIIHGLFLETEEYVQSLHKQLRLWERLLYLFTFYACFSVFPNAFRHLCTTMPWTIWPSLVILWGVCWMFYGSPPSLEDDVLI